MVTIRAFSPFYPTSIITNSAAIGYPISTGVSVQSTGGLAMRVGMQVPFLDNGLLLKGYAEFFTGDLDEIRIWKTSGFGVGLELETAQASNYPSLLLYIPVRYLGSMGTGTVFVDQNNVVQNVGNGVLGPVSVNAKPAAGAAVTAALSMSAAGLAWNVSLGYFPTAACLSTTPAFYVQPASTRPCFTNYIDQRAAANLSRSSSAAVSLDDPSAVAAATPTYRVNFPQLQPDAVAYLVVRKPNWRDTVYQAPPSEGGGQVLLVDSVDLSVNSGLPFAQSDLAASLSSAYQAALPAYAGSVVASGGAGSVLAAEPGCVQCTGAACNCLQVTLSLSGVGRSCPNVLCPAALANQSALRLLCLDWWVPRARGWTVSAVLAERSPLYTGFLAGGWPTGGEVPEAVQAVMGYEASPEWLGPADAPYASAFTCAAVSYQQDVGVADGLVYVVVPGAELVAMLRARDRNLGDATDVLPLDDPGLPNGARLCPAVFYDPDDPMSTCDPQTRAPSMVYQTTDCPGGLQARPPHRIGPAGDRYEYRLAGPQEGRQ